VQAYPRLAACLDDGSSVSFSFFNRLYVLNVDGKVLANLGMAELCSELFQDDFSLTLSSQSKEVISHGDVNVAVSFGTFVDGLELPVISAILPVSAAGVFLVAYRNALLWITSEGKVAHALQLSLGSAQGMGGVGAIQEIEASEDGRVIVAHITCCGICVIVDGKEFSAFSEEGDEWYDFALDKQNNLIAIHSSRRGRLALYDLCCTLIEEIPVKSSVRNVVIPGRSQLLFASGDTTMLFDLR
jgi:hypothetical protein